MRHITKQNGSYNYYDNVQVSLYKCGEDISRPFYPIYHPFSPISHPLSPMPSLPSPTPFSCIAHPF